MASYRPFPPPPPPQSNFGPPPPPPPNHTSLPPPPPAPPSQPRGNQYSQNWGYPNSGFQQQQHFASYPPPLPPPEPSYPPPPPPPSQPAQPGQMYFPSSQHGQLHNQPIQPLMQPPPPPPPPPFSPPSSSAPPPPPPPSPPPPPLAPPTKSQAKEKRHDGHKRASNDPEASKWRNLSHSQHAGPSRQHSKPANLPPVPERKSNGPPDRVETEEERRLFKKREMEKQRQEEKHRQQLKESQNKVLQKTQMLSSGIKPHGSISGSHMGDRRATPFLSGERIENRLKKPTTFLCKLK